MDARHANKNINDNHLSKLQTPKTSDQKTPNPEIFHPTIATTSTTKKTEKVLTNTAEQLKSQLEKLTLNSSGQVEDVLRKRLSDSANSQLPRMPTKPPLPTCKYYPTPTKTGKPQQLIAGSLAAASLTAQLGSTSAPGSGYGSNNKSSNASRSPFKNIIANGQINAGPQSPLASAHATPNRKISDKITIKKTPPIPRSQLPKKPTMKYRYFICIDFEATCDGDVVVRDGKVSFRSSRSRGEKFENEIISFPCVIVDILNQTVVDEFHTFIKPALNSSLTTYCKKLTGIEQGQVDAAPNFKTALKLFEDYFKTQRDREEQRADNETENETDHANDQETQNDKETSFSGQINLTIENTLIVSDSSYDFCGFLRRNCVMHKTRYPTWAKQWVNLKKLFVEFYAFKGNDKQLPTLRSMVESAGLKFRGKLHSGMDDVDNMSKLLLRMVQDGLTGIKPNEVIDFTNGHPYYREIKGKTIDAEANRLAKLMAGDCQNVAYNQIIKQQLSPEKRKRPARKVELLAKQPPIDFDVIKKKEEKNVKTPEKSVGSPKLAKLTEISESELPNLEKRGKTGKEMLKEQKESGLEKESQEAKNKEPGNENENEPEKTEPPTYKKLLPQKITRKFSRKNLLKILAGFYENKSKKPSAAEELVKNIQKLAEESPVVEENEKTTPNEHVATSNVTKSTNIASNLQLYYEKTQKFQDSCNKICQLLTSFNENSKRSSIPNFGLAAQHHFEIFHVKGDHGYNFKMMEKLSENEGQVKILKVGKNFQNSYKSPGNPNYGKSERKKSGPKAGPKSATPGNQKLEDSIPFAVKISPKSAGKKSQKSIKRHQKNKSGEKNNSNSNSNSNPSKEKVGENRFVLVGKPDTEKLKKESNKENKKGVQVNPAENCSDKLKEKSTKTGQNSNSNSNSGNKNQKKKNFKNYPKPREVNNKQVVPAKMYSNIVGKRAAEFLVGKETESGGAEEAEKLNDNNVKVATQTTFTATTDHNSQPIQQNQAADSDVNKENENENFCKTQLPGKNEEDKFKNEKKKSFNCIVKSVVKEVN